MKSFVRSLMMTVFLVIVTATTVLAQAADCPAWFAVAVQSAVEECAGLGQNQVCLASGSASLETQPGFEETTFSQSGDVIDAATISSLTLTGDKNWPLVLMRLQLTQAESAPDTHSVVLLMGDASLTAHEPIAQPPSPVDEVSEPVPPAPLTNFDFTSSPGACGDSLPNGLLIQSPNRTPVDDGYLPTQLRINGWDFSLGSTVLIETGASGEMVAEVLEHYVEVGGEDGSALVLVGENIELPPGTPYVGNEDGSLVVIGSDGQAANPDSGIFDFLDDLLGEEEIANRPVPPPPLGAGKTPSPTGSPVLRSSTFTEGFWFYEVGMSRMFGECLMGGFDVSETSSIITLDDFINYDPDTGELLGYIWPTMGVPTIMPFEEGTGDYYVASDRNPIGSTLVEVEIVTRFVIAVTITETLEGPGGLCFIETPVLMESCLVDVLYGNTKGGGICPKDVHEAMGTL